MAQTPASKRPAAAEQRRKVAEGLVAEARSRITATNRTLIALLLLIAWSWLSNLSGIDFTASSGTPTTRVHSIIRAANDLKSYCTPGRQLPLVKAAPPAPRNPAAVAVDSLAAANAGRVVDPAERQRLDRRRECESRRRQLVGELRSLRTDFNLLVITVDEIHLKFHPLLIVLMIGFTLAYATWNRYRVSELVTEAVQIYKETGSRRSSTGLILYSIPFWLWPLSSRSTFAPTPEDFEEYLAVDPNSRARRLIANGVTAALVAITLHTIALQSFLSTLELGVSPAEITSAWNPDAVDSIRLSGDQQRELASSYVRLSYTGNAVLDVLILFAIFIPSLTFLWASELVTNLSGGKRRAARGGAGPRLLNRRVVLASTGFGAAVVIMLPAVQQRLARSFGLPSFFRSPRFRAYRGGSSRRSPVVALEERAVAILRNHGPRAALDFIWSAIILPPDVLVDPPSHIRLYDLLAGLAVRYGMPNDLRRLIEITDAWRRMPMSNAPAYRNKRWMRARAALARRVERWRPLGSEWRSRWTDAGRTWHDAPLPPARAGG